MGGLSRLGRVNTRIEFFVKRAANSGEPLLKRGSLEYVKSCSVKSVFPSLCRTDSYVRCTLIGHRSSQKSAFYARRCVDSTRICIELANGSLKYMCIPYIEPN